MERRTAQEPPAEVMAAYGLSDIRELRRLTAGHIHATWRFVAAGQSYICQRLARSIYGETPKRLEHNYRRYVAACAAAALPGWQAPVWRRDTEGCYIHRDAAGEWWRVYGELPGEVRAHGVDAYRFGEGLGRLHHILDQIDEELLCAVPDYRSLEGYERTYRAALQTAGEHSPRREAELERWLARDAAYYQELELVGCRVLHGDTKQSNAVFTDGCVSAWIDLDTLMSGARVLDLADALRSLYGDREQWESGARRELARVFLSGYEAAGERLAREELQQLPAALALLYYELGLRYYTDYISGGALFGAVSAALKKVRNHLEAARLWQRIARTETDG